MSSLSSTWIIFSLLTFILLFHFSTPAATFSELENSAPATHLNQQTTSSMRDWVGSYIVRGVSVGVIIVLLYFALSSHKSKKNTKESTKSPNVNTKKEEGELKKEKAKKKPSKKKIQEGTLKERTKEESQNERTKQGRIQQRAQQGIPKEIVQVKTQQEPPKQVVKGETQQGAPKKIVKGGIQQRAPIEIVQGETQQRAQQRHQTEAQKERIQGGTQTEIQGKIKEPQKEKSKELEKLKEREKKYKEPEKPESSKDSEVNTILDHIEHEIGSYNPQKEMQHLGSNTAFLKNLDTAQSQLKPYLNTPDENSDKSNTLRKTLKIMAEEQGVLPVFCEIAQYLIDKFSNGGLKTRPDGLYTILTFQNAIYVELMRKLYSVLKFQGLNGGEKDVATNAQRYSEEDKAMIIHLAQLVLYSCPDSVIEPYIQQELGNLITVKAFTYRLNLPMDIDRKAVLFLCRFCAKLIIYCLQEDRAILRELKKQGKTLDTSILNKRSLRIDRRYHLDRFSSPLKEQLERALAS